MALWRSAPLSVSASLPSFSTGEWVVPREQFREIEGTDLGALSTVPPEPPTTRPSTQPAVRPGELPPAEVLVSIGEVREMALRNNLELAVQLLNPAISRTGLSEEEAQFESTFTLDANYAVVDQPTASELNATEAKSLSVTPGVNIPLLTGGTIRLAAPFNRFETNNQFSTLNPAYESDVSATLSQPLLRGAGLWVTGQRIRVAFYSYQQTEAATKLEVIRVLAEADRVYWRLYAAREQLRLREQQYELAVTQLERARRQARIGVVPEVDVIRAESGVADQIEAIILAENDLRDRQRELKRILNQPGLEMDSPTAIVPATPPIAVPSA